MKELHSIEEVHGLMEGNNISLLLIKTENCGVCESVLYKLNELKENYGDVEFAYLYAGEVPMVAGQFLVFTAPTVIIFAGGKEVFRQSRFIQMGEISETLDKWVDFFRG
jgi:thioredoxin-like negative regulator of GroEL